MTTVAHVPFGRRHPHAVLYAVLGIALLALVVVGLFTYESKRDSAEARAKAAQLIGLWEHEGLPTPATDDIVVRTLGTDGGALCTTTGKTLAKAFLAQQLSNGAAGPGQRAVIVARRTVAGARAIIEVYCPERLTSFDAFVADLKYDDVVRR